MADLVGARLNAINPATGVSLLLLSFFLQEEKITKPNAIAERANNCLRNDMKFFIKLFSTRNFR